MTLRENTERPESVDVGANVLAGTGSHHILDGARKMHGREKAWNNPFGDGTTIRFIIRLPVPQWRYYDCHHLYK